MVDPVLEFHPDRLRPLLKTPSARSAMLDRSLSSWGGSFRLCRRSQSSSSFSFSGAKLDDFADFTTFGIATSLLLRTPDLVDNVLCMCYVLSVFVRLCFFSSGRSCSACVPASPLCSSSRPCRVSRDPLRVPRPPLHLLLRHTVQRLPAVGGKHEPPAGAGHGHDHLHDPSDLLPP